MGHIYRRWFCSKIKLDVKHEIGRTQFGRISIANSDSEAYAYVDGAIKSAWRAVQEQTS
jgi:spermidine dehydrogenase